jgi:pimeloyl-ACP methyl ester carboxylesterase
VADLAASRLNRWLGMPRETVLSFYDHDPHMDIRALLPAIRVPTLIVHGTEDRQVPFAAAEYLATNIPGAQLYPFKGYGHVPLFTATQSSVTCCAASYGRAAPERWGASAVMRIASFRIAKIARKCRLV